MSHNTYMTYLMGSDDGTSWEKVYDIKDFPDLGGDPNTLDDTTLSDAMHTYIEDIIDTGGALSFTANYDVDGFAELEALKGQDRKYAVWFGGAENEGVVTPDGRWGKFTFAGTLSVRKAGHSVGAVQDMKIYILPSAPITFSKGTSDN